MHEIFIIDESTKNVYFHTDESILDDQEIDYTKLFVMSAICIGTIFGNVVVILAIVARNIKVHYIHEYRHKRQIIH